MSNWDKTQYYWAIFFGVVFLIAAIVMIALAIWNWNSYSETLKWSLLIVGILIILGAIVYFIWTSYKGRNAEFGLLY